MSEVAAGAERPSNPLAETPDIYGAYPRLSVDQIATLESGGAHRTVDAGELLVREGERAENFFVILAGKVAVSTADDAGNRRVIRVHGPGRFLGELGDLEGQAAFYTAETVKPGEVLVADVDHFNRPIDAGCLVDGLHFFSSDVGRRLGARLRERHGRTQDDHNWCDFEDGSAHGSSLGVSEPPGPPSGGRLRACVI